MLSHTANSIMGKRACPFDIDYTPQMKIHVSDKEVASGISRNEQMKRVYDKTLSLLFRGARNISAETPSAESPGLANMEHVEERVVERARVASLSPMKQMMLTTSCQLQHGERLMMPRTVVKPCSNCHVAEAQDLSICAFCDKTLCTSCTVLCKQCHNYFCSGCTFEVYDQGGSHVCKNCL